MREPLLGFIFVLMRVFGIVYIVLSLALNFYMGTLTTLLIAFVSFPLVFVVIRKKRKP